MGDGEAETPRVKIKMERHRFMVAELSSQGFGSPQTLMETRVDLVFDAYEYLQFKCKYEHQTYLIGRKKWM